MKKRNILLALYASVAMSASAYADHPNQAGFSNLEEASAEAQAIPDTNLDDKIMAYGKVYALLYGAKGIGQSVDLDGGALRAPMEEIARDMFKFGFRTNQLEQLEGMAYESHSDNYEAMKKAEKDPANKGHFARLDAILKEVETESTNNSLHKTSSSSSLASSFADGEEVAHLSRTASSAELTPQKSLVDASADQHLTTTSNALVPAEAEEAPAPLTSPELEKLMAQQEALKARMEEAENELDEEKGPALVKARLEAEAKAASTEYENAKMMGSYYIPNFKSPAYDKFTDIKDASNTIRTLAESVQKLREEIANRRKWSSDENAKISEGFKALKPSIDFLKDFDPSVLVAESANIGTEGSVDLKALADAHSAVDEISVYNLKEALGKKVKYEGWLADSLGKLAPQEKELEAAKAKYLADMSAKYGHDLDWESFIDIGGSFVGMNGYRKVEELKKQMEAASAEAEKRRDETAKALKEKDSDAEVTKRLALPTLLAKEMKKLQLAIEAEQKKLQENAPLAIEEKPKTEEVD